MVTQTPPPIQDEILSYYNELRERMNSLPELMDGDDLQLEVVTPKLDRNDNSHARRVALQALYELDAGKHDIGTVLTVHLVHLDDAPEPRAYAHQLVLGVNEHRAQLDTVIHQFAPAVPVGQLALVDRTILRIALLELLIVPSQPISAVIDEAVELATHFGAESSASFINGVLGAVVEHAKKLGALRRQFAVAAVKAADSPMIQIDESDEDVQ